METSEDYSGILKDLEKVRKELVELGYEGSYLTDLEVYIRAYTRVMEAEENIHRGRVEKVSRQLLEAKKIFEMVGNQKMVVVCEEMLESTRRRSYIDTHVGFATILVAISVLIAINILTRRRNRGV